MKRLLSLQSQNNKDLVMNWPKRQKLLYNEAEDSFWANILVEMQQSFAEENGQSYFTTEESSDSEEAFLSKQSQETPPLPFSFKPIKKIKILSFLESILHVDLSNLILTDITFNGNVGTFTVVGRPQISGSSKKQLSHVIPYSFVKNLIEEVISKSHSPKELLSTLTNCLLIFAKKQQGYAIKSSDLQTTPYKSISSQVKKMSNRKISLQDEDIYLASPSKKSIFTTPTKKSKAKKDFSLYNIAYIKAGMKKFSEAISDHNTATMAAEALARFIFIIFNKSPYAAFHPIGNTANFELRLYDSSDDALQGNKNYEIVTARELEELFKASEKNLEIAPLDLRIRAVNCEGSRVKETPKALQNLDSIIAHQYLFDECNEELIDKYNINYNFTLKLPNYKGDISAYNSPITYESYKNQIPFHIAKLLYMVFGLQALENTVFVPERKGQIKIYNSATGDKISTYSFDNGDEYREYEVSSSRENINEKLVRNKKLDLKILPQKLAELFTISTSTFSSFKDGFFDDTSNFLNNASLG